MSSRCPEDYAVQFDSIWPHWHHEGTQDQPQCCVAFLLISSPSPFRDKPDWRIFHILGWCHTSSLETCNVLLMLFVLCWDVVGPSSFCLWNPKNVCILHNMSPEPPSTEREEAKGVKFQFWLWTVPLTRHRFTVHARRSHTSPSLSAEWCSAGRPWCSSSTAAAGATATTRRTTWCWGCASTLWDFPSHTVLSSTRFVLTLVSCHVLYLWPVGIFFFR